VKSEIYKKLVDLYAGNELPAELNDQLEMAAFNDPELAHDMATLRKTVDILQRDSEPEFTEESYQRILLKMYSRGAAIQPVAPDPAHLQYSLPMQG
jgi:hypothetical protein